jgi:uncharacterized phage protein (TIGR01671 family)
MREIKFRAWDRFEKKFIFSPFLKTGDSSCDWIVFLHHQLQPEEYDLGKLVFNNPHNRERFEIMQYTGLHDKNDKEIYEGDLVKYQNDVYKVDFEYAGFSMTNVKEGVYSYPYLYSHTINIEVIGNIYENPELL